MGRQLSSCAEIYNRAYVNGLKHGFYDFNNRSPYLQHMVFPSNPRELVSYYAVSGKSFHDDDNDRLMLHMGQAIALSEPHRTLLKRWGTDYDRIDLYFCLPQAEPDKVFLTGINRFRSQKSVPAEPGAALDGVFAELDRLVKSLDDGYTVDFLQMKKDVWQNFEGKFDGISKIFTTIGQQTGQSPAWGKGTVRREYALDPEGYGDNRRYVASDKPPRP